MTIDFSNIIKAEFTNLAVGAETTLPLRGLTALVSPNAQKPQLVESTVSPNVMKLRITKRPQDVLECAVVDRGSESVYNLDALGARADWLWDPQLSFTLHTYKNVKQLDMFWAFYGRQPAFFIKVSNGVSTPANELAAPCMRCGLVLPTWLLTIDHQRPKAHGQLEAVAKAFRALGMTVEGPRGAKGQWLWHNWITTTQTQQPPPLVKSQNGRPALPVGNLLDRYTLNQAGLVLYTLLHKADLRDALLEQCTHHLVNLKPVCSRCNPSIGGDTKFTSVPAQQT